MNSLIQFTLLAVAALSVQLATAQSTQPPIEAQFRIVNEYVDRRTNVTKLVVRCMSVEPKSKRLGFLDNTPEQDAALCQSNDTLFTIVRPQSATTGNFFIGDYSSGTAKQVFLEQNSGLLGGIRAYTVNNNSLVVKTTQIKLNDQFSRLETTEKDKTYFAILISNFLVSSTSDSPAPSIMRVTTKLRRFRLKRLDPTTNVTSCASVLNKDGFIGYPSFKNQMAADKQCVKPSAIFTFNTQTSQLRIGARIVTTDTAGRLRTSVDNQPPSLFYLRPESYGFDRYTGCMMCRINGGLMVAQPTSTLLTGLDGFIRTSGLWLSPINREFWTEFV